MSKNEKRWIVLLIAVVVILVALFVGLSWNNDETESQEGGQPVQQGEAPNNENEEKYVDELDDGTKVNTSESFNSTKTYNNLEISNIQYTSRDGMSVLLADVKNTASTKHEMEVVKLTIYGDNGEVITEVSPVIEELDPGETIQLNVSLTADLTNAKDFTIESAE